MGRLARRPALRASREDRETANLNLERVGMAAAAERPVATLSGGEFRRVMLAQSLSAGAELLVLDEPTTGLDLPAEQEFYSLLGRLRKELSLTVIAVSHDLLALGGQADELVCINRRIHLHGNPEEVVHSHAIQEAYSCEFDFIAGELAHHSHQSKQGQS
jgi:zinc transport system ATP-binding protein